MDNIDNFIEIEEEVTESGVNTEETSDKPKKEKKLKFKAKKEKKEKSSINISKIKILYIKRYLKFL